MQRRIALMLLAVTGVSLGGTAMAAEPAAAAKQSISAPLTIYHIEGRRSERIVWLCEELGLPYTLEFKRGDIGASMQAIRSVSPLMPVAPTVRYGDQVMVESGAIIELLLAREGRGRLQPAVSSADYPYYLQWMHFAEGSFASRAIADYRVTMIQGRQAPAAGRPRLVDSEAVVKFADDFLGKHPYFGGADFSAADIMMLFPVTFAAGLNIVEMDKFPNVVAWRKKIEERPAYQRMLKVARPDGLIGSPPALPKAQ